MTNKTFMTVGWRARPLRSSAWVGVVAALVVWSSAAATALAAKKTVSGVININEAPAAVLVLLPGVGPAKAERIIAYRQRHRFATVEELGRVKGIGPKTVRKLRLFLTVRGPTTAQAPGATSTVMAANPGVMNPATNLVSRSAPAGSAASIGPTPARARDAQTGMPAISPPSAPTTSRASVPATSPASVPATSPASAPKTSPALPSPSSRSSAGEPGVAIKSEVAEAAPQVKRARIPGARALPGRLERVAATGP